MTTTDQATGKPGDDGLDRRTFIQGAGVAALATALPAGNARAAAAGSHVEPADGRYDFDAPYNRAGFNCARWDSPARDYPAGVFKYGMGVATMDFECAPCITQALEERVAHHSWGYMSSTDSLREAIIGWAGERHDMDLGPDEITLSDGVYPGMIAAMRSFVPMHGKVLTATPAYNGFYTMARRANVQLVDSQMRKVNGRYEFDWDDLEAKMTPDVRAMIVCNPQNPTGNVWTEEELLRIGRLCLANNIVVLSDEIHCDFIRAGHRYVPFASLPDRAVVNNSVTFLAISKTFNLAGMKNAYYYSKNPTLLERVNQFHGAELSTLGVVANEAAYREGGPWFDQANAYIDSTHAMVENFFRDHMPQVGYTRNEGTFMTFLDFSATLAAIDAEKQAKAHGKATPEEYFQDWLVHESGVYLNPGSDYGAGGAGHMRMNVGSAKVVVRAALEAMAAAVNKV